jgi:protein-S-isoprenylcysteine O-methyltransferase Ste14
MSAPEKDSPQLPAPPPVFLLLFLTVGGGLHAVFPLSIGPASLLRLAGGGIILAAVALVLWARQTMVRAGTNIRPTLPALTLVAAGPYRFTRNPMYLSLSLLQLGFGLVLADAWPVLLTLPLVAVLHWGVIRREENYLRAKFGEPYRQYLERVRRWI